jgi:hypothetical protein
MAFGIVDARRSEHGLLVTFETEHGITELEGSPAQIERLAEVMRQVAAIAPLHDGGPLWIEDVVVGDAVVKLGLGTAGTGRVRIVRSGRGRREG